MPSRRTLLRAVSAATGGILPGCALPGRGVDGYVQLKSLQGVYTEDGKRREDPVVRVTLGSPPGSEPPEVTHRSDEWMDRFDTPTEPVVPDTLQEDLERAFDDLRYVVGVCSPSWADDGEPVGCYNVATTRDDFNRAQVRDHVRASSDGTSLTIHSVEGTWAFDSR